MIRATIKYVSQKVSIHAPMEGANFGRNITKQNRTVSIHAPMEGAICGNPLLI